MTTDDELDSLREKSARTSAVYDDLEGDGGEGGATGVLGSFTPQQRLILALLLLLNILALACALLVFTGRIIV